ncbi:MAG: molybdopterin cofactor-binding domain-containing protein, partial [Betaproteobacteria bacterium]
MKTDLTRRQFLKMTGTGLAVAVASSPSGFRLLSAAEMEKTGHSFRPNVWLEVRPDNTAVVTVNKSEMGQGVHTALPMIVADELDADWKNVRVVSAPADAAYNDPVFGFQLTGGSTSVRHMYAPLRLAGAAAREMLVQAAAKKWKVPAAECTTELGTVRHAKRAKALGYGMLAASASKLAVPQNPVLKTEKQFRYIGKEMPRNDIHDKVNGLAHFGIDSFVP